MVIELNIILTGLISCLIGMIGCSNNDRLNRSEDADITQTSQFEASRIVSFQNDSDSISIPENLKAIPLGISNNGIIPLSVESNQGLKSIGYYDDKTAELKIIHELDTADEETAYYLAGMDNDTLLIGSITSKNTGYTNKVQFYDLKTNQLQDVVEYVTMFPDRAIGTFSDLSLFLNYRDGEDYKTFRYEDPFQSESATMIVPDNSGSFIEADDKLYYLEMNKDSQSTTLWEMSQSGENKKEILSSSYAEGWFSNLLRWKGDLILTRVSADGTTTDILKVNRQLGDYDVIESVNGFIDNPQIGLNLMVWWNPQDLGDRFHTKYSIFDLNTLQYIEYKESLLFVSDYGIVWVKFMKDEKDIPKGMIFDPGNSEIMLFKAGA